MSEQDAPLCPWCKARLVEHRNVRRVELVCACGYEWCYDARIADVVSVNGVDVPPFVGEIYCSGA